MSYFTEQEKKVITDDIMAIGESQQYRFQQNDVDSFIYFCEQKKLNPLLKQVNPLTRWDKKTNKLKLIPQVGIDGLRAIAHRSGCTGIETKAVYTSKGALWGATATILRNGNAYKSEVLLSEYNSGIGLWKSKPHTMIQKVAEAHGERRAFPEEMAGIYIMEEMDQATEQNKSQPAPAKPKDNVIESMKVLAKQLVSKAVEKGLTMQNGWNKILTNEIKSLFEKKDKVNLPLKLKELSELINDYDINKEREIYFKMALETGFNYNLDKDKITEFFAEQEDIILSQIPSGNTEAIETAMNNIIDRIKEEGTSKI